MKFVRTIDGASPEFGRARISTERADSLAREKDGLLPGQILHAGAASLLPDILDKPAGIPDAILELSLTEAKDTLSIFENSVPEAISLYDSQLSHALSIGEFIADLNNSREQLPEQPEGYPEQLKNQMDFVCESVQAFMAENPTAVLDIDAPQSTKGLGEFITFYKAKVRQELENESLVTTMQQHRQLLVETLAGQAMKHHLGATNARRIAGQFERQPLVITDPLTVLTEFPGEPEPMGWYDPENRLCYIDPISIRHGLMTSKPEQAFRVEQIGAALAYELDELPSEEVFQAQLLEVMAHEFMHAATNDVFRAFSQDSDYDVSAYHQWPSFFYEGMVEKAAYLLALTAAPTLFEGKRSNRDESNLRTHFSDNPAELLATKAVASARERLPSSYATYRLVIDTIMAKADWAAAGVTRKQADKLAVQAFFDRPDTTTNSPWSARKNFMQALHTATHPGFLNKLGELVNLENGDSLALDVLESPQFDPHYAAGVPWLISPRKREKLEDTAYHIARTEAFIKRQKKIGYPRVLIDQHIEQLEDLRAGAQEYALLELASEGLAATLLDKYGSRRRSMSREERFHRQILKMSMSTTHQPVTVDDLEQHQAAVDAWQQRSK